MFGPRNGFIFFFLLLISSFPAKTQPATPANIGLGASSNPVVFGQPVTLIATVTSGATGKVTFYDGISVIGIATLSGGQAVLTTRLLPAGTRSLHAYYGGDLSYLPATSLPVVLLINPVAVNGFQMPKTYGSGYSYATAAGDLNGDGKLDVVYTSSGGYLSVLIGNGDGTFAAGSSTSITGSNPQAVVVGDLNGDGKADVVTANSGNVGGTPRCG
jgi:hypothetical protein